MIINREQNDNLDNGQFCDYAVINGLCPEMAATKRTVAKQQLVLGKALHLCHDHLSATDMHKEIIVRQ